MSHGTDALYGFAAHDPRRSSPQAQTSPEAQTIPLRPQGRPQSIVASVALAFVTASCAWTVWTHVGGDEVATFEARFATPPLKLAAAPAAATTVVRKRGSERPSAGLFDSRHLSLARGTFSGGGPSALAAHLVPATTSGAPRLEEAVAQAQPPAGEVAESTPLPASRPTRLASLDPGSASSTPAPYAPKAMVEDKATVLALISSNKDSLFNKLFGKPKPAGTTLAYASADGGIASDAQTILFDGIPKYDQWTAVYDISARKVYLPDGTELEAHSGLGKKMDDPRHVHVKMHGATPPHVYSLSMREALFHGVEALRLTPVGGDRRIFGRKGLLTHTYLLGPRGDSNGCISFKDYDTFLRAYKKGLIKRLVVVSRLG